MAAGGGRERRHSLPCRAAGRSHMHRPTVYKLLQIDTPRPVPSTRAGTQKRAHQGYQLIGVRQHLLELAHRNMALQSKPAGKGYWVPGTAISKLVQFATRCLMAYTSSQVDAMTFRRDGSFECTGHKPAAVPRMYKCQVSTKQVVLRTYRHMQVGCTSSGCSPKQGIGCLASPTHVLSQPRANQGASQPLRCMRRAAARCSELMVSQAGACCRQEPAAGRRWL